MPISFALGFFGIRRASHPPKNSAAKKEKNYYKKDNWQSGLPFAIVSLSFAVVGLN